MAEPDHIFRRVPDLVTGLIGNHDADIENGVSPEQAMLKTLDKAFGLYRGDLANEVRAMTDVPRAAEIADRLAPKWQRPEGEPPTHSEAALADLRNALTDVQFAAWRLGAPNADGQRNDAIETQLAEIRKGLDAVTRRLDELPTA